MRAQAALELLLVLAALFAAWAALLPASTHALQKAQETAVFKQQEAALQQLAISINKAAAMPPGSVLEVTISLKERTRINQNASSLVMHFGNSTISEKVNSKVEIAKEFSKGRWILSVKHERVGMVSIKPLEDP